jgi:phage shock protein A
MVFGFGKKKDKKPPEPKDPIAAYDGLIEDLDRQAAEVRKSAATLLSLRGELSRDVERYRMRGEDIRARLATAQEKGDVRAARVLGRDLEESDQLLETSRQALASAEEDGRVLVDAAQELAKRLSELRAERQSARARLSVGVAISTALKEHSARIDKVLALDKARDEVERARALADIYREDFEQKK